MRAHLPFIDLMGCLSHLSSNLFQLAMFKTVLVLSFLVLQIGDVAGGKVQVAVPFGKTAVWVAKLKAISSCADGDCDEETRLGVHHALRYAINNAKLATRSFEDKKFRQSLQQDFQRVAADGIKLESQKPGRKWQKKFERFINDCLEILLDKKVAKALEESVVYLDVDDSNIGLAWRKKSVNLPVYDEQDIPKALKQLTFKMPNGVEIPRIGFGTWQIEGKKCRESVLTALKVGYRHIDTAESYENEQDVGEGIQDAIKQGIIQSRDDVFLVTKLSSPNLYQMQKVRKQYQKQLNLLQTNYTDVYMLHGPESPKKNSDAWKGMAKLKEEGKIRALGVSNFDDIGSLKDLTRDKSLVPMYIQNKYSVYFPGGQMLDELSMLKVADKRKMAFVGYSIINPWPFLLPPLKDPHVLAIAERYKKTPAQILHRWALQLNMIIIPKSVNEERIKENAAVVGFSLKEVDMRLLNGLSVLYHSWDEHIPNFVEDVYGLLEDDDDSQDENEQRRVEL